MAIADQFRGLPIEDLIVSPLIGMAKGQAKLNDVTWKYINEVAFEDAKQKSADGVQRSVSRNIDLELNRYVANPDTGKLELQQDPLMYLTYQIISTFLLLEVVVLHVH